MIKLFFFSELNQILFILWKSCVADVFTGSFRVTATAHNISPALRRSDGCQCNSAPSGQQRKDQAGWFVWQSERVRETSGEETEEKEKEEDFFTEHHMFVLLSPPCKITFLLRPKAFMHNGCLCMPSSQTQGWKKSIRLLGAFNIRPRSSLSGCSHLVGLCLSLASVPKQETHGRLLDEDLGGETYVPGRYILPTSDFPDCTKTFLHYELH